MLFCLFIVFLGKVNFMWCAAEVSLTIINHISCVLRGVASSCGYALNPIAFNGCGNSRKIKLPIEMEIETGTRARENLFLLGSFSLGMFDLV